MHNLVGGCKSRSAPPTFIVSLKNLAVEMISTTLKWQRNQVHIGHLFNTSLPPFSPYSPPPSLFATAENALKDGGISYSSVEQAVVGYVYGMAEY